MANHSSAYKRIRSDQSRRARNRYQLKTCRTAVKRLKQIQDKQKAEELFQLISAMLDKLSMKQVIHKNKAARNKSNLYRHIHNL